jgi:hypothetical protein
LTRRVASSSGPGRPVPLEAKAYGPAESARRAPPAGALPDPDPQCRLAHRFGYAFCREARDTTDERLRDASRPQPRVVRGDRVLLNELVMILYDHLSGKSLELTEPFSVLVEGALRAGDVQPGGLSDSRDPGDDSPEPQQA